MHRNVLSAEAQTNPTVVVALFNLGGISVLSSQFSVPTTDG